MWFMLRLTEMLNVTHVDGTLNDNVVPLMQYAGNCVA